MPRSYANLATSIWNDEDFCALSAGAQRTYFMLISQPDISAAGTLALTLRRWTLTLREDERGQLPAWIGELVEGRYVVCDERTEELLVRTFIRWDNSYTNPRRQPSIKIACQAVRSARLRTELANELSRLGLGEWLSDRQSECHSDRQSGSQPDSHSDSHSDRQSECLQVLNHNPQPTTHNPGSPPSSDSPAPPAAPAEPATKAKPRLPSGLRSAFEEFWAAYPRRTARAEAERKFAIAARDTDPARIVAAAKRYAAAVTNSEPRFIAHPSTWLHQGRWDDEPVAQAVGAVRRKPWEDENGRQIGPIPWWADQ